MIEPSSELVSPSCTWPSVKFPVGNPVKLDVVEVEDVADVVGSVKSVELGVGDGEREDVLPN
jgi:hypothetical protein